MNKGSLLSLHTPLCDYLTITGFNEELKMWFDGAIARHSVKQEDYAIKFRGAPPYEGTMHTAAAGSAFCGVGWQNGMPHYMVQVSGEMADDLLQPALTLQKNGLAKATRIDLQVTVPYPAGWNQFDFLTRMNARGRMVNFAQSKDTQGRSETVYVGARTSERFTRIYVKLTHGGEKLLRLEVEYKGKRAAAMGRSLRAGKRPAEYLAHELQTTFKDKQLTAVFAPCLNGAQPHTERVKISTNTQKTERWLLEQVLPAFVRTINAHDADQRVALAFGDALEEWSEQL